MTNGRDIDNSWTTINIFPGFSVGPAFVLLEVVLVLLGLVNMEV